MVIFFIFLHKNVYIELDFNISKSPTESEEKVILRTYWNDIVNLLPEDPRAPSMLTNCYKQSDLLVTFHWSGV